jgi:hypothetical protein
VDNVLRLKDMNDKEKIAYLTELLKRTVVDLERVAGDFENANEMWLDEIADSIEIDINQYKDFGVWKQGQRWEDFK